MLRTPGTPVPGPDAQHAVVEQLRKAEYHRHDRSYVTAVSDWISHRFDALLSGSPSGDAMLVLLVLVAAAVIFAVVRAGPVPVRRAAARGTDPLATVPAVDHWRRARDYTANGQRAEALREWLRAAIQTIEERGVLTARPGRTGAATAREAGTVLPAAAVPLRRASTAFDEVWFGGRDATDADVELARAAAEQVAAARIAEPRTAAEFVVPR